MEVPDGAPVQRLHVWPHVRLACAAPFCLHALIEIPAAISFFVRPLSQLVAASPRGPSTPICTPALAPVAALVVRQYAVLLFVSSLIALVFAVRPPSPDPVDRYVAAALAVYHLAPLYRAAARLRLLCYDHGARLGSNGTPMAWWQGQEMGGPWVHAVVHAVCFTSLLWYALAGSRAVSVLRRLWLWRGRESSGAASADVGGRSRLKNE